MRTLVNMKKTTIIIGLIIVTVAIGAFFLSRNNNSNQLASTQAPFTNEATLPKSSSSQPQSAQANPEVLGHLPILGKVDAPVTIIELGDFECPSCRHFTLNVLPDIKKEFVDTGIVRFAFRHFPLTSHPNAKELANAAECANDQVKFWEMHDELFKNQQYGVYSIDRMVKIANTAGVSDITTFRECVKTNKHSAVVQADYNFALSTGAQGTPTVLVNNIRLTGSQPITLFRQIIQQELN